MMFTDYCKEQIALMPDIKSDVNINFDLEQAEAQLNRLRAAITRKGFSLLMWMSNKLFRSCMHGVFVEAFGLKRVKDLLSASKDSITKNRIVYMPIFKSLVDVWVLYYVYMTQKMGIPFTFGNDEEIPRSLFVEEISKMSGYVFMNKARVGLQNDYINIQLLKETIADNPSILL
jgi:hypothetical protein